MTLLFFSMLYECFKSFSAGSKNIVNILFRDLKNWFSPPSFISYVQHAWKNIPVFCFIAFVNHTTGMYLLFAFFIAAWLSIFVLLRSCYIPFVHINEHKEVWCPKQAFLSLLYYNKEKIPWAGTAKALKIVRQKWNEKINFVLLLILFHVEMYYFKKWQS